MKNEGLVARKKKRFKVVKIKEESSTLVAPRIFKIEDDREYEVNEVWVGDITYIPLNNKFLYLSVVLDVGRRKIVGWSLDDTLGSEGVTKALADAYAREGQGERVFHSDQGVQYKSFSFIDFLKSKNGIRSMSRKGNCYDNAYVETFFKSFKRELIWIKEFSSEEELKREVFQFIEIWYNRKRMHSALDYKSPLEYELEIKAA